MEEAVRDSDLEALLAVLALAAVVLWFLIITAP